MAGTNTNAADERKGRPEYQILIGLVEVWEYDSAKDKDPMKDPEKTILMTEFVSIEIEDTYRKLICGASVKFPRGSILHKIATASNGYISDKNTKAFMTQDGVIIENKNTISGNGEKTKLAEVTDFKVGWRIRIRLGYTEDPKIAALGSYDTDGKNIYNDSTSLTTYRNALKTMFEGYITKVSLDDPIELECENLASGLKMKTCPNHPGYSDDGVNTFLSSNGKHKMLEGTGIELYPQTEDADIRLGKIQVDDNLVLADLLDIWAKRKVYSFLRIINGKPYLLVGRSYFSDAKKDSIVKVIPSGSDAQVIDFSWDVPESGNNLTLMNTDKKYIGVSATCLDQSTGKDKFTQITVVPNPEYDSADPKSEQYRVLNESALSKKEMKAGKRYLTVSKDKVDLKKYNIIPYMSPVINCKRDQLVEEAIKYLETYNPNGIEGTVTIFGDYGLSTGIKVELVDNLHTGKNGIYFVDEVKTEFGVNGYRQTLKLPYCISRKNKE